MADFHQNGIITTLHGLYEGFDREAYQSALERRLTEYGRQLPICLLLPCLHSEMHNERVLGNILSEIQGVNYIHSVIVALGGAQDATQFHEAKEYFERLRTPERDVKIVWVDGPRIQELFRKLQHGKSLWGCREKGSPYGSV